MDLLQPSAVTPKRRLDSHHSITVAKALSLSFFLFPFLHSHSIFVPLKKSFVAVMGLDGGQPVGPAMVHPFEIQEFPTGENVGVGGGLKDGGVKLLNGWGDGEKREIDEEERRGVMYFLFLEREWYNSEYV